MIFSIAAGVFLAWLLIGLLEVICALALDWLDGRPVEPAPGPALPAPLPPLPQAFDPEELRCSPSRRSPEEQALVDKLLAKLREGA